jgi:hypothetical protein
MTPFRFLHRAALLSLGALTWLALFPVSLRAAEADGQPVMLPPLEVVASGPGSKPWEYAAFPGGEVLSHTSRGATREFLEGLFRLQQVIALILPEELQGKRSVPDLLILTKQSEGSNISKEIFHETRARAAQSASATALIDPDRPRKVGTFLNLRLNDSDSTAVYAAIDEYGFNGATLQFTEEQLHFLLRSGVPRLPEWFIAGMEGLFEQAKFKDNTITFGRAGWAPKPEGERILGSADYAPKLLDMIDLLEKPCPPARDATLALALTWRSQAALFVRWMLISDARRPKLWKLVARAASAPMTEEICQQTIGLDYLDLRERLGDYVRFAMTRGEFSLKVPKLKPLPAVEIRPATHAETARLRGDWERLVANWVRLHQPTFIDQYVRQARRTLNQAYERGERDPGLLAVLGLFECDLGNDKEALPYLEAAQAARVVRPRVYFELARIRYAAALAKPQGDGNMLNSAQLNVALEPFKIGFEQNPPLLESYRLMAEAWSHGSVILRADQLAVCDRAVKLFPTDPSLLYNIALIKTLHGRPTEAVALAQRGADVSDDPAAKAQFKKLVTRLATIAEPAAATR